MSERIEAVCEFLKTKPSDMIKTLIFSASFESSEVPSRHDTSTMAGGEKRDAVVVCLLRGDHELNENKAKHASGAAHLELAGEAVIQNITGAAVGFAGPQGLVGKVVKMLIDPCVAAMAGGVSGANKTNYHIKNVVPGRDFPLEGEKVVVADIRNAAAGDTHNGKPLMFSKGIEVGHVFKLGTKYSVKLGAKFKDEAQQEHPCIMGCYGIGINRIMASAIETRFDKDGIVWPVSIAPFEVIVTPVNQDDAQVSGAAEQIYKELSAAGIDVLLDDRDARGGVKFKDADLLGIPVRVTIGKKSIAEGNVEIKLRSESESRKIAVTAVVAETISMIKTLKEKLGN